MRYLCQLTSEEDDGGPREHSAADELAGMLRPALHQLRPNHDANHIANVEDATSVSQYKELQKDS